jgi:hypothetical protein
MSGRPALAEAYFVKALDARQKLHPAGHWRIDEARGRWAWRGCARPLRRGRGGSPPHEGLRAHRGPDAAETKAARTHLDDLHAHRDRPERVRQDRSGPH